MIFRIIRNLVALLVLLKAAVEASFGHYDAATFYLLTASFMVILYRDEKREDR